MVIVYFFILFNFIAFVLTLVAIAFIYYEKQIKQAKVSEMIQIVFGGRYVMVIMGIFGMYCGLLYNDFFSLGINLFGSVYTIPNNGGGDDNVTISSNGKMVVEAIKESGKVYPFGLDPIWHAASNELTFVNSMKMKLAVIIGIIHVYIHLFVFSLLFFY